MVRAGCFSGAPLAQPCALLTSEPARAGALSGVLCGEAERDRNGRRVEECLWTDSDDCVGHPVHLGFHIF